MTVSRITPIPIKVAITVNGDGTLFVDYTGSSPQVHGALNSTLSFTHSLTYLSVRCVLAKDLPNNVGLFRCIKVKAPEASVLNPVMPAPCAARALTGYRVFDTMLGALAQIVPDRVPAAGEGGNSVICISGLRPNRQPFIIVDMICGAWGGRPDKDGIEAVTNASQNLSNMPVEVMEAEHPVRIEDYSFVPDSCGAGPLSRRRRHPAELPHSRRRGAVADAHRPRAVRAVWACGRRARRAIAQLHGDRQRAHGAAGKDHDPHRPGHADHSRAGRRRRLRRSAGARSRAGSRGLARRQDHGHLTPPSSMRVVFGPSGTARHGGNDAASDLTCRPREGAMAVEMVAATARKVTRNPEASRARILDAARNEFVSHGLSGARVDRIANHSGVNKNLIYHYFGSKDALYLAVLEDIYAGLRATAARRGFARAAAGGRHQAIGRKHLRSLRGDARTDPADERREHPFRRVFEALAVDQAAL